MKSPFKFLDAYELEDRDVFFGRDKEIQALYEMVFKTPLILLYGKSGTGKTSLIQCGLASRFKGPDWIPIFIRREEDINRALHRALKPWLQDSTKESLSLAEKIGFITSKYFRPVYLIFDQFEELFTLSEDKSEEDKKIIKPELIEEESTKFITQIKKLIDARLLCKVIFVIREEYLGALYPFEEQIPAIFDFRLRVEPMENKRVAEVMHKSFRRFHISLEAEEKDRIAEMIDNISEKRSRVPLPYLQVYLDQLYKKQYKKRYRNAQLVLPPLTFTIDNIKSTGGITQVLNQYLQTQKEEIYFDLTHKFPNINLDTDLVIDFLYPFTTKDGTKQPIKCVFDEETKTFTLHRNINEFGTVDEILIDPLIKHLLEKRILRDDREGTPTIELAHDSLADIVREQFDGNQKIEKKVYKDLNSFYQEHGKRKRFLDAQQLSLYDNLPDDKRDLFEKNKKLITYINNSKDKLRKSSNRKKATWGILAICTLLAIVGVSYAFYSNVQREKQKEITVLERKKNNDLNEKNKLIKRQTTISKFNAAVALKESKNYQSAIEQLEGLSEVAKEDTILMSYLPKLDKFRKNWVDISNAIVEADHYKDNLITSLYYYQLAAQRDTLGRSLEEDAFDRKESIIIEKISSLKKEIIKELNFELQRAKLLTELDKPDGARFWLNKVDNALAKSKNLLDNETTIISKKINQIRKNIK